MAIDWDKVISTLATAYKDKHGGSSPTDASTFDTPAYHHSTSRKPRATITSTKLDSSGNPTGDIYESYSTDPTKQTYKVNTTDDYNTYISRSSAGPTLSPAQLRSLEFIPERYNQASFSDVPFSYGQIGDARSLYGEFASNTSYFDELEEERRRQKEMQAQSTEARGAKALLSEFLGAPTRQEAYETAADRYERETGIDLAATRKERTALEARAKIAMDEYDNLEAAMEGQIAQTWDKAGSMNFLNNQVAQIKRNAAPELNRLASRINADAAWMSVLEGRQKEAIAYIDSAVDNSVADKKDLLNNYKMFYEQNEDALAKIDSEYKAAFDRAYDFALEDYKSTREDIKQGSELAYELMSTYGIDASSAIGKPLSEVLEKYGPEVARLAREKRAEGSDTTVNSYESGVMDRAIEIDKDPMWVAEKVAEAYELSTGKAPTSKQLSQWRDEAERRIALEQTAGGWITSSGSRANIVDGRYTPPLGSIPSPSPYFQGLPSTTTQSSPIIQRGTSQQEDLSKLNVGGNQGFKPVDVDAFWQSLYSL